jgi:hypothetical protein
MFNRLLEKEEQQSRLFGEMLRRFACETRRDMTMSDAFALRLAISRCRACGATDACEAWVASTDGTEGADQFCPNTQAFRQLGDPAKS